MKILLPVHHFLPRYTAGAELYTYRLARWLSSHGHQPEVVCVESIEKGRTDALDVVQDQVDDIPVWRLSMDLMNAPQRRLWTFDNPLFGQWFDQHLARWQPDLVHFQAGYLIGVAPMRAVAQAGIPALLTLHDYWYLCPRHTLLRGDGSLCEAIPEDPAECTWCYEYLWEARHQRVNKATGGLYHAVMLRAMPKASRELMETRRKVMAEALRVPRFVLAPSEYMGRRAAPWVAPDRLRVQRTGIELGHFSGIEQKPVDDSFRVGYIGQITEIKGVHLLMDAFQRLHSRGKTIELHVHGGLADNAFVRSLRQRAEADKRIELHGRFENARVGSILGALDVLVVPSLWYENMPLSILESYAAGTPVVTTETGGMAEPIQHDVNGLHFKLGDAGDLARQLQRLIDEPELLRAIKAGALASRSLSVADELSAILPLYTAACAA
jgi:glycosyltransferase involved in cell wall biosynthesis